MIQYIVILLDDTSVSFCHYQNKKNRRRLMPLETLKSAIVYAMKENMSIQIVYPDYPLLSNYEEIIDSTDHIKIKPAKVADDADVVVFNSITEAKGFVDYQGRRIKLNFPSTACLSSPHSILLSVVLD